MRMLTDPTNYGTLILSLTVCWAQIRRLMAVLKRGMEAVCLPQFNWSVFGPILLAFAAVGGGIVFLVSISSPHAPRRVAAVASAPIQAALDPSATTFAPIPPHGLRLPGRATGSPHLRAAPSSEAAVVGDLQSGETIQASGCSASCGWYLVTPSGQAVSGWVSAAFVSLQGDDRALPVVR